MKASVYYQQKLYLFSEQVSLQLQSALITRFQLMGKPEKDAKIFHALLSEMIVNAVKATHKRIYYKYVVKKLEYFSPSNEVAYEKWLKLFIDEIEINQYTNLHYFAKKEKQYVTIKFMPKKKGFLILVQNFGVPSDIESKRIRQLLDQSKNAHDLAYVFESNMETHLNEGAGLGIGLIIMVLRHLKIKPENFEIKWGNDKTVAVLNVPWSIFKRRILIPQK